MTCRRTTRQRNGAHAEDAAADYLRGLGWQVVDRNVRVGRDEVDIVAVDPGPPPTLVCVEVRGRSSGGFGLAEERVDRHKVRCLYRAAMGIQRRGAAAVDEQLAGAWRVDLVTVDRRHGLAEIRHLRALEPP